jgi:hypothetical protein
MNGKVNIPKSKKSTANRRAATQVQAGGVVGDGVVLGTAAGSGGG